MSAPPRILACSLFLSAALMLACAGQRGSGGERVSDDAAGKAATSGARPSKSTEDASSEDGQPAIDVVAMDPGDARPCERMCGRVGDCMQTEEGATAADATSVEFVCLDSCVYADPLNSATTAFQACDEKSGCGELLGCARGRWDAVTAARRAVEIPTQFAAVRDTCESACLTMQSCSYFYRMPDDLAGLATADFYVGVEACTEGCRNSGETSYGVFADCALEDNCDQFWNCTSRAYAHYP